MISAPQAVSKTGSVEAVLSNVNNIPKTFPLTLESVSVCKIVCVGIAIKAVAIPIKNATI